MNRPLARRAGPFLVALTGLLLTAAGAVPRGQDVAAPRQATGATGTESSRMAFGRDGMIYMTVSAPGTGPAVVRSQDHVLTSENPGAVLRLEPVEATTTR